MEMIGQCQMSFYFINPPFAVSLTHNVQQKSNLSPKIQAIIQHISQTKNSELVLALFGPLQFMKCFYPLQLAGTSHNPEEDAEKTRSSFSAKN